MSARALIWPAVVLLAAGFAPAGGEPLDPDDLTALLVDLEASGGILTAADFAVLAPPAVPSSRGRWNLAVTGRATGAPRVDLLAARATPRWSFRARARRDGARDLFAVWIRTSRSRWTLDVGGGALAHGSGLLAAPPGRRSSLAADTALLPPRPGWRPSTATEPGATVLGGALSWTGDRMSLAAGTARDHDGGEVAHARGGLRTGPVDLAGVLIRRGSGRGWGLDLRWRAGEWSLAMESAHWRLRPGQATGVAWHLAALWRRGHWRAEVQTAVSDAPAGLDGAARPACLPGWRGRGWAVRMMARPASRVSAALIYGRGEHRDPGVAAGDLDDRALLGLQVTGPGWEVRLRRAEESRRRWDSQQPWLPAALDRRRSRIWLTTAITLPAGKGEARYAWRRLEEGAMSRNLLSASWTRTEAWGRGRVGIQLAWGDPLDLVAVSAPVPGLVRLRHWGHWRSGVLIGADGGRTWRWQCGGEVRWPSPPAGGELMLEIHAGCGRSF